MKFPSGFDTYACTGDCITVEHGGITYTATIECDWDTGAPWEEHDGHGPVSNWTTRAKMPGELILSTDGPHKRYYDFAEACRIARRDGWGCTPYDTIETPRQCASRAAMADYEALRAWCDDEWFWCGIVVTATVDDCPLASDSLWGIECNYTGSDNSYLLDVANELLQTVHGEAIAAARAMSERLAKIGE